MDSQARRKRRLQQIFLLAGLGLFALLILRMDPEVLWIYLQRVGPSIIWILLLGALWYGFYAYAWELFLKTLNRRIGFWQVFKMKVAGEAFSAITPLSWAGGDPMRVLFLKEHIPFAEGAASVVVDRTLNNLALALFMIIGIGIGFFTLPLPAYLQVGLAAILALLVGVSVFFFLRSRDGLFQFFFDWLKKLRLKKSVSPKTQEHITDIDAHISQFYRSHQGAFYGSFFLHFLGRLCAVAELYLAAVFIGFPLGVGDCYLLASLTVLVNLVFVFLPGSFGVMEGAFAGTFALMHLDPAIGTALQIVRRIRMLFWTGFGFLFMSQMKAKSAAKPLN